MRLTLLLALLVCPSAVAEPPAGIPSSPEPPLTGALVIAGGGKLPPAVRERFLQLAGGDKSHLVVIPTASQRADERNEQELLADWKGTALASLKLLHTRTRERANADDFVQPLKSATGVWIDGGDQTRLTEAYLSTTVQRELKELLARGGVIGGTSAGAAIMSRLMIAGGARQARLDEGLGMLTNIVIDQHFLRRNRTERLLGALHAHPGYVGLGIDERTAVIVQGRELSVIGDSYAVVCLAAGEVHPVKFDVLRSGERRDIVALSRAALERAQEKKPVATIPEVPHGALVIGGGGDLGMDTYRKFVELTGSPHAPIVVIGTAQDTVRSDLLDSERLRAAGALDVQVLNARTPVEAAAPEFMKALKNAHGVWFAGGRQWRLVDAYSDTPAEQAFHAVLKRDGVIGGSSAGASIQAGYMVRGNPLGNEEMMAEGYERGFGFLPGVAIDQHFSQRNRRGDMLMLMSLRPDLVGIGIDERTAIIVRGTEFEVMGQDQVEVFESHDSSTVLHSGERYDLKRKRREA